MTSAATDTEYEGPWQEGFRDIDPTCTLKGTHGGTEWEGHVPSWWAPVRMGDFGGALDHEAWIKKCEDLPSVPLLIAPDGMHDGANWLNLCGYFSWKQPVAVDRDPDNCDRREAWFTCQSYLIRRNEVPAFMSWAETVDFWGSWMPEQLDASQAFLGEHHWSPAARYFQRPYYGDNGWVKPKEECPAQVRVATMEYRKESTGFDCSVDENFSVHLPGPELMDGLKFR